MPHKSSVSIPWRLKKYNYSLTGTKCNNCNLSFFPPKFTCIKCNNKTVKKSFSGMGKIVSFTVIRTPPSGFEKDSPYIVGIVKLEEGVNISTQIKGNINSIDIGKDVKIIFRKIFEDGNSGLINYGFKFELID